MNSFQTFLFEARYRQEILLREAEHERLVQLAVKHKACADSQLSRYLQWIDRLMSRSVGQWVIRLRATRLSQRIPASKPVRSSANCG